MRHRLSVRHLRDARLLALLGYTAVAALYFGWRLLPHPGRIIVGQAGQQDPDIFIWSFGWWPHALLHGLNPFFSHEVYAPTGVNLAWVTSVPAISVAFAPITLLFGPTVAYNLACILLPALSAWTAFLLCRSLTRSTWGALVGGYLYGFSSYVLAHELSGHVNLISAFVPPLVALVVVKRLRGELDARGLVWRLALLLACQAYISTEVAVTMTLVFALGLVLAFLVAPSLRGALVRAVPPIVAGYAGAGILAAPMVYYGLTGIVPFSVGYPWLFSADPLNLVVPTRVIGWGGSSFAHFVSHWRGNDNERDSYLGVPVLLIVLLLLVRRRPWGPGVRFAVGAFAVATFLSLGTALWIDGHRHFWLPWSAMSHLEGLKNVIPSRFALFASLPIAALVALWIASSRGRVFSRPYALPALAVAALVPPFWSGDFVQHPARLAFFTTGAYEHCIPAGETVMVFPFARWGRSLLWQAETGFRFKLAEGALGPNNLPESFAGDGTVGELLFQFTNYDARPTMANLLGLMGRRHVDRVVSARYTGDMYPNEKQMETFGKAQAVGDVYVSPGCGQPPLRARAVPAP